MGTDGGAVGQSGGRYPEEQASSPSTRPPDRPTARPSYSPAEMMATVAARELRDGEVVFVGVGLPNLACNLARATHAPRLVLIYESGAVGAEPERLPVSIGDPSLVTGSLMVCGMADVFQFLLQNGRIEVGFLGGAQIDRFGNINTTVVGSYDRPAVRLPGSGGGAELHLVLGARRAAVLCSAGSGGEPPLVALPERRRDLLLDQAAVRRGSRFSVRLVLLGQQHPVLPQPADVHRRRGNVRVRARRHRTGERLGLRSSSDAW